MESSIETKELLNTLDKLEERFNSDEWIDSYREGIQTIILKLRRYIREEYEIKYEDVEDKPVHYNKFTNTIVVDCDKVENPFLVFKTGAWRTVPQVLDTPKME